jgi:hypothetical protein
MNFSERERYRDVIRLKFAINKFLLKMNDASYCKYVLKNEFYYSCTIF